MPKSPNLAPMVAGVAAIVIFAGFLVYYMLASGPIDSSDYFSNFPIDLLFITFVFLVLPVVLLKFFSALSREYTHDGSRFDVKNIPDPQRRPQIKSHS